MTDRIVMGPAYVAEGAEWLATRDLRWRVALDATGPWPDRLRPAGFPTLVQAIVSQQVSVASAAAIGARVESAGLHDPETLRNASDALLQAAGLSRPKQRYLRALAEARIDFDALAAARDDDVIATLTEIKGIGVWTAEIYALFALGRADVFPAGDLALQEGARLLFDLRARPTKRDLRVLAEDWQPWRGVAARGLWAYYAYRKQREGIR